MFINYLFQFCCGNWFTEKLNTLNCFKTLETKSAFFDARWRVPNKKGLEWTGVGGEGVWVGVGNEACGLEWTGKGGGKRGGGLLMLEHPSHPHVFLPSVCRFLLSSVCCFHFSSHCFLLSFIFFPIPA